MVGQDASDYTRRWCPNQKLEFLSLTSVGPKVRYLRAGQGPVLVLLHSIRTQLDLFQRVIPKLTDRFTVYAFDYPGFGWSEIVPGADYREPAMRGHVVDFIEGLDLRDVILAGESMGATLALTVAAVLGDRVKQVVAFNPYDYWPGVERASFLASIIIKSVRAPLIGPIFAALESPATLAGILRGGFHDPRCLPSDFVDELIRSGRRPGYSEVARAIYRSLESYVAARSYYMQIDVPVTLVYADHDWSRPAEREANLARIKQGKMIAINDASHICSLEKPEEVAQILINAVPLSRR
ncbi:alpha/beta hydrolase [Bradyrhizobium sp. OK095]|jgi:pimeloyl-ACP methyl ester carboxylesterase|uniref:alpha/beta fold hydrolase n=1 Tax=Bradyrhizobium sp. OK095 TaxID=1882760 RepID=UPI0008BD9364|nr:alpha/beta hydrolase [Bradyrhizobium sp. OK095]SEM35919.1 Pimeloyl-ACP methyl ester carboxylesterase [Bradyrhizobium sp. OK095]